MSHGRTYIDPEWHPKLTETARRDPACPLCGKAWRLCPGHDKNGKELSSGTKQENE